MTVGWCICAGGGNVGVRAARAALEAGYHVLVIDSDPSCPAGDIVECIHYDFREIASCGEDVHLLIGDAVGVLIGMLRERCPELVVPAIRGHLAALLARAWMVDKRADLEPCGKFLSIPVDTELEKRVVLRDVKNGVVITSYMPPGNECVTGCDQKGTCPVTGEIHPEPMHSAISRAFEGMADMKVILVPVSLGAVGVLRGEEILRMLRNLEHLAHGKTAIIATACNCHGIINFLRKISP